MKRWLIVFTVSLAGWLPGAVWSQSAPYPFKTVRLVLPFGAGGAADAAARPMSENLTQLLGQPVVIENRPGAGQNIGTQAVVSSAPDGYNILMASEIIMAEHLLDKALAFNPVRDLAPVARIAGAGTMLTIPGDFPAKNLAEFLAQVKANPGKFNFVTVNNFELPEMADFRDRLGIKMVMVPYKGSAAAHQALMVSEGHLFASALNDALSYTQAGKTKAIAYTGATPHFLFPNVPTVAGSNVGLNDWDSVFAFALFLPAATPQDVINKIHNSAQEILRKPDVIKRYRDFGYETFSPTIAEYKVLLAAKTKRIEDMLARGLKLR